MGLNGEVRQVVDADALLGEGVVWDAQRAIVWFVDIKRCLLWSYDPATGQSDNVTAPDQIGWALPCEDGTLLCGLKDGLHNFDPSSRAFTKLMDVLGEPVGNRLNDACTDPWGRVWFGSMDDAEDAPSGRFYVLDRGEVRPCGPENICITNGPAINAQGDRIYFTDSVDQKIMVAKLSKDRLGEVLPFVDTAKHFPNAHPDGPVVDSEDHVWTGLYGGKAVARFSPDGELVDTIEMPARDITKMAFGGSDLTTAFVTTATKNLEPADKPQYPLAGGLLSFEAPVAGFAQPRVKL